MAKVKGAQECEQDWWWQSAGRSRGQRWGRRVGDPKWRQMCGHVMFQLTSTLFSFGNSSPN